jgi:hypothetical protein
VIEIEITLSLTIISTRSVYKLMLTVNMYKAL